MYIFRSRYGLAKTDFPAVLLFVKGQPKPYVFNDAFSQDKLQRFVTEHSKPIMYIGLPGTLENFDKLVSEFIMEKSTSKREDILSKAEELRGETNDKHKQRSAEIYIKTMRKALEKGDEFFHMEPVRIGNLLKGSLTKEKKADLTVRLNILESFKLPPQHSEL